MCQFKKKIVVSEKTTRKRKSARLDPQQARKRFCIDDANRVTVVFDDVKNNLQEEHCIYRKEPVSNMDDEDDNDDAVEEVTVGKEKTRTGHRQKFPEDILKFRFMKRSCDLSFRCQQDRTNDVSKQILASCVDRKKLKETGMEYIQNNMDLALDVVTFIDLLIYNLSSKLHINLLHLDNIECYNVVHDGDDKDTVVGGLRKKQKVDHKLARDLLKEMTG